MTPKLKEAARTINMLAKQENDARLALCRAIAGAMDLVKKESNLPWRKWADANLRKPDGSKWSPWTLYSYASFGRDPKKLGHLREAVARHGRIARRALRITRSAAAAVTAVPTAPRESGNRLDRQVEALMFAWRNSSAEARKRFLELVVDDRAAA